MGLVLGLLLALLPAMAQEAHIWGRVVDENNAPVSGARIVLFPAGEAKSSLLQTVANPDGSFEFRASAKGNYYLEVNREGFFRLEKHLIHLEESEQEVNLVLNRTRELLEKVDVPAQIDQIDPDRVEREKVLTGQQILDVPYPNTNNLKNTLRLVPGIVQDTRGGVHLDGGAEDQAIYTLDGFNISDPLTGRFETRLSVESVRAIEVSTGRFSPEFGKGSAGAVAIKTVMGDDKFRYSATNFVPGFETRKGLQFGNWTPRLGISGPLWRGRAWFSDSVETQYDALIVEELPKGSDRSSTWRSSNLVRTQVNLTPANILYAGFLASRSSSNRIGLSVLDPPETTVDRRSRQWFFNLKDQIYLADGALVEFGYALNRTFGREIPQGQGMLQLTPEGRRGNQFVDAARFAGRDQWVSNLYLPAMHWAGTHRFKLGLDLDRVQFRQDVRRTGFEQFRENNILVRHVVFGGSGAFERQNFEAAGFVQDAWKLKPSLLLDAGIRYDWDRLVGAHSLSPRFGIGWSPRGLDQTRISGGYGIIYDASSLRLFTRPLDQYWITTHYDPDGGWLYGPALAVFHIDPERRLRRPRYEVLSVGLEQRFPGRLFARFDLLRKRGRDGFTYASTAGSGRPIPRIVHERLGNAIFDAIYELENDRRDVIDSASVTVRKSFGSQYELMGSYTRSRAMSNAVVDVNIDDPIIVSRNVGPMPWDVPNRLMSWGYLPTPSEKWAVAYLLDCRTGFPFYIQNDSGYVLGDINQLRFPYYLQLNLHLERKLTFRGYYWAIRFGANNLTNRQNPTLVNNNSASPNFLSFYGGQRRTFNARIRWLGKAR